MVSQRACCTGAWVVRLCGGASGLFGLTAVVLGALGAHLLGERLDAHDGWDNYNRAKLYFFVHALVLAAVTAQMATCPRRSSGIAGLCFILGTVGFAGSLLVVSLTGWKPITNVTPLGGISLMAGWIVWGIGWVLTPIGSECDVD